MGGGIITASPEPAMDALQYADYGMIGEGDITICELAEAIEGIRSFESVNGLIFKLHQNCWHLTEPRQEISDLDSLPIPDYDGFEYDQMLSKADFDLSSNHGIVVSFSRSCPFNCTFCFHPSGTKYRKRSIHSVLNEIDYLVNRYHVKSVYVSDELFALRKEELNTFCAAMAERKIKYTVSLRVDAVNIDMLSLLKNSGCQLVLFGLESASNTILKSMNKHITIEQIDHALQLCHKIGLPASGNFIFGDEAETVETYQETLRWWKSHPQYHILLGTIIVFPGSELYKNAVKRGLITNQAEYIKSGCPRINITQMSDSEFRQMMLDVSTSYIDGTDLLTNGKYQYSRAGLANLSGECPFCGSHNVWEDREAFREYTDIICAHCGRGINISPSRYIDWDIFKDNFNVLAKRKFAIWGIMSTVELLYDSWPESWNYSFELIDSSPYKIGLSLHGKIIRHPDVISQNHIDTIVIPFTSMTSSSIVSAIRNHYPSVKKVLFLSELLNAGFSLNINEAY